MTDGITTDGQRAGGPNCCARRFERRRQPRGRGSACPTSPARAAFRFTPSAWAVNALRDSGVIRLASVRRRHSSTTCSRSVSTAHRHRLFRHGKWKCGLTTRNPARCSPGNCHARRRPQAAVIDARSIGPTKSDNSTTWSKSTAAGRSARRQQCARAASRRFGRRRFASCWCKLYPNYEFRYLKNLLERDTTIELHSICCKMPTWNMPQPRSRHSRCSRSAR